MLNKEGRNKAAGETPVQANAKGFATWAGTQWQMETSHRVDGSSKMLQPRIENSIGVKINLSQLGNGGSFD